MAQEIWETSLQEAFGLKSYWLEKKSKVGEMEAKDNDTGDK